MFESFVSVGIAGAGRTGCVLNVCTGTPVVGILTATFLVSM